MLTLFFCSLTVSTSGSIAFCTHGSEGSCVPRSDGNGFDCKPGGAGGDCGGTVLVRIKSDTDETEVN